MIDFARGVPAGTRTEHLGDEIARLAAHIHAATYELLVLIRRFDEAGGWGGGFRSCAHWLSWRTGMGPGSAREKVRVARALASLPLVSGAMAQGELSFSKVRAVTRVATPSNEADLLEIARHGTASQVERVVRAWRRVDRNQEAEDERLRHLERYVRLHPDESGMWVLRGRLDPEVGAVLEKALEWAGLALYREESGKNGGGSSDTDTTAEQRRADALGLVAERALAAAGAGDASPALPVSRADRYQVILHTEVEALTADSDEGQSVLDGSGVGVPAGTSRRLACDASVVEMRHDAAGNVLDVGRRQRTVPPAIRRALEHRDRGCRFPGCGSRYTDAHHIEHWADGGRTTLDNLVLLCRRHHRAVHEEGWRVDSSFRFYRPDGRRFPDVPPARAVPRRPVAALTTAHQARGIAPDAWTATPAGHGQRLDLDWAMLVLRQPSGPASEDGAGGRGG